MNAIREQRYKMIIRVIMKDLCRDIIHPNLNKCKKNEPTISSYHGNIRFHGTIIHIDTT